VKGADFGDVRGLFLGKGWITRLLRLLRRKAPRLENRNLKQLVPTWSRGGFCAHAQNVTQGLVLCKTNVVRQGNQTESKAVTALRAANHSPKSSTSARSIPPTLAANATQPSGACGLSPSATSGTCPNAICFDSALSNSERILSLLAASFGYVERIALDKELNKNGHAVPW